MNKKKLMCILLAVTTVCCNLLVTDTRAQSPATEQQEETKGAQESKGNEAEFQIKNGVLVRYTGGGGDVVIPEGVTSIGDGAFGVHYALISITIPEGVTSIGKAAFGNCSNLESISIPTSVTSIGWAAFAGCSSLTNIVIPEGIAIIEDYTFKDCSNLKNFAIPKGVISIGVGAFNDCNSLKSITIPEGVTSIGQESFMNCSSLSGITIPESVTSIGYKAFTQCGFTSITIPKGVASIGEFAFPELEHIVVAGGNQTYDSRNDCNAIIETETNMLISGCKNTYIPEGVTSIGDEAFYGCDGLTNIIIPEGVTSIGYKAFYSCDGLTNIIIPEGVTSIGYKAFEDCENLTSITMPESVISIDDSAFSNCHEDFTLLVTVGSYAETYAKKYNISYRYMSGGVHIHSYVTRISAASIGKDGSVTKICARCGDKTTTTIYAPQSINLSKTSFTYNNRNQKPSVTVKDSKGKALKNNTDYTVSYPKNVKNVGQYTVTINFKGNYSGTVKKTFTIVPKGTSISKVTPKKKGLTVKWKKQLAQTTGYEIACSTDSKFSKKNTKIVPIGKNKTTSKSVSKLRANKKYYIRIRTYKTVKGKKYYSNWSKVRNITTKK
ncbi:MAG: leucine-rich repeat protein [Lachnospiraceae bacterium]|nr:leucine-rich repeat protein [Lachnospiraceae bacterium]